MNKQLFGFLLIAMASITNASAQGERFPTKPVRVVIPFAPGGGTDVIGRPLAHKLSEILKQQVIYDNRPGADGAIAASLVAKSRPDGYTLFFPSSGAVVMNVGLYSKLPYDPVKDFAPITMVAIVPTVLVVNASLPIRSVAELVSYAKANPGKLNWAYSASSTFMTTQLFRLMSNITITPVPYKGAGQAVIAMVSGESDVVFQNPGVVVPHIKSGRLRAIGVTSEKRVPLMPDLPTISESGLAGFEGSSWYGLLAPADTPRNIISQLNEHTVNALSSPEIKQIFSNSSAIPVGNTPDQFAELIRNEISKWGKVIKDAGIKPK